MFVVADRWSRNFSARSPPRACAQKFPADVDDGECEAAAGTLAQKELRLGVPFGVALLDLQRLGQVRGAAMTEYTILVGVVGILTIGAIISLGVALVVSFEARRDLLLYPATLRFVRAAPVASCEIP